MYTPSGNDYCVPYQAGTVLCQADAKQVPSYLWGIDFGSGNDLQYVMLMEADATPGPLWSTPMKEWFYNVSNVAYEHVTGFYGYAPSNNVIASMEIEIGYPVLLAGPELNAGTVVLALQTQDIAGNWNDVSTVANPTMNVTAGTGSFVLTTSAPIPINTGVRLELRSHGWPNTSFWAGFGSLTVPECVPDMTNPGQCLP
jgi:hypothetical protein